MCGAISSLVKGGHLEEGGGVFHVTLKDEKDPDGQGFRSGICGRLLCNYYVPGIVLSAD